MAVIKPNTCFPRTPSTYEVYTLESFNLIKDLMYPISLKGIKKDEHGLSDKATIDWDTTNDLMYLNVYLFLVKLEMDKYLLNNSLTINNTVRTIYIKQFDLDCVTKQFACKNINIKPILAKFGLLLISGEQLTTGIGYDSEYDNTGSNGDTILTSI